MRVTTGEPLDFFDTEIDFGPAIGSFRISATPYALDPPLPAGSENAHASGFPLDGEWYLGQGNHGVGTHQSIPWAYDWHRVDGSLLPEFPQRSATLTDNFSYGRTVHAPEPATVVSTLDDQQDCPPYAGCGGSQVNFVYLETTDDIGILLSHTIPGSIVVSPTDPVTPGQPVAQLGNSGTNFSFPHLHHELRDAPTQDSLPVALVDIEVGLNPGLDSDPWKRRITQWVPREGFLVREARATGVPGFSATAAIVLVIALLAFIGWRFGRG